MADEIKGADVLSSLPRSRPERRSAKRDTAAKKTPAKSTRKPAAKKRAATTSKASAATTPKARAATTPKAKSRVQGTPRPSAATRRAREDTPKAQPAPPPGRDPLETALATAGELARIGLTVGTQIVREATRRLPKP